MHLLTTRRRLLAGGAAVVAGLALPDGALSQAWPSKPIRIVVGYPAGGLTDLFARAYGEYISQKVGQPVLVENKAGAGGILGAQTVKAAPADGHTLMFTIATTMIMNRVLYKELPYDPDKDFVLISSMSAGQLPFVVHKSTGAKTLEEFFVYAKANKVTYGSYAPGSYAHIAITRLNKRFGTNIEVVHYRGESPMWQDFNAGVIQAASGSYQAVSNILQTGVGKAVAVPLRRSKALPDVPTFKELGVDDRIFTLSGFICLVGPAGTPKEVVERLSALMVEGGKTERVQKLLETFGVDEAAQGHEAFRKLYDAEKDHWIDEVRSLGLTPQ
jgi:tripartite-type tricarboxylate transporter receptor subunit TctC